ncbi:uncharacterized protein LOC104583631 [Brachypodium distachyon]|uniref:uncharacterized protein LOC104583631 n=1 Tax=Brachypodium distachyon TaxID=15368 RepID=UPI00052FE09D|nr:uncharacterized protein LOC104583631 [Brachypodium distachyon]|eukprot:XP_024317638.1 uncharacterized protein LOC104583631 [Brachypodium distachyon]
MEGVSNPCPHRRPRRGGRSHQGPDPAHARICRPSRRIRLSPARPPPAPPDARVAPEHRPEHRTDARVASADPIRITLLVLFKAAAWSIYVSETMAWCLHLAIAISSWTGY